MDDGGVVECRGKGGILGCNALRFGFTLFLETMGWLNRDVHVGVRRLVARGVFVTEKNLGILLFGWRAAVCPEHLSLNSFEII